MKRYELAYLLVVALLVVVVLQWFLYRRETALNHADTDASIRLLHDFHLDYLNKRGVDQADYRKEFSAFAGQHNGLRDLERYDELLQREGEALSP